MFLRMVVAAAALLVVDVRSVGALGIDDFDADVVRSYGANLLREAEGAPGLVGDAINLGFMGKRIQDRIDGGQANLDAIGYEVASTAFDSVGGRYLRLANGGRPLATFFRGLVNAGLGTASAEVYDSFVSIYLTASTPPREQQRRLGQLWRLVYQVTLIENYRSGGRADNECNINVDGENWQTSFAQLVLEQQKSSMFTCHVTPSGQSDDQVSYRLHCSGGTSNPWFGGPSGVATFSQNLTISRNGDVITVRADAAQMSSVSRYAQCR